MTAPSNDRAVAAGLSGIPDDWLHDGEWARVGKFFIYPREPDFYIGVAVGPNTYRDVDGIAFLNIEAAIDHARWMVDEARAGGDL
jgi:hypothetical protein